MMSASVGVPSSDRAWVLVYRSGPRNTTGGGKALRLVPDSVSNGHRRAGGETLLFMNAGGGLLWVRQRRRGRCLSETLARRSVTVFAPAYGLKEGRLTPTIILPIVYGPVPRSIQFLRGLSMTEGHRTNIGVMNFGEQPANVTLALQRLEGRPIAMLTVPLRPQGSYHVPLNLLFPLVEGGDDFTLVVDSTTPETFSYAVVLSNETHAGTFVMPLALPR